MLALFVENGP
jgi:carboxypeptidase C (cathepsin A)